MSVFVVIVVRIFPHLDRIRRDMEYLSIFSPNVGKCRPECLRIRTLSTQCCFKEGKNMAVEKKPLGKDELLLETMSSSYHME